MISNAEVKHDVKAMTLVLTDDTQKFRFGSLAGLGKPGQKSQIISPYGLCTNPPDNSLAIAFNMAGYSNSTVAIVDDPENRKKNLAKGEVAIVNYLTGSEIYCKTDGSIEITSNSGANIKLLASGDIELNGNSDFVTAFTDMQAAFDQLRTEFNTMVVAYNTAVYSIGGVGTTGTTSVPGVASTADMSSAKVETVKVP